MRSPARVSPLPRSSRALVMPGPLAPSSHLGVTLQRHLLASALRYTLYHLGLPLPDKPPVRIERLRLYLDSKLLVALLGETPGGLEVAAALIDPAGSGPAPRHSRLGAALAVHRLRLWPFRPPRPPRPPLSPLPAKSATLGGHLSRQELWRDFRGELSAVVPALGGALLAEVIASVERRAARQRGERREPCISRAAHRFLAGKPVALHLFGAPDLRQPSWAVEPERAQRARLAAHDEMRRPHRYRGRYRLVLRAALDRLRPLYLELARRAADRAILDLPDDAFFFPLDLAECLARDHRPNWLEGAVATNRAELIRLFDQAEPPEMVPASGSGVGAAVGSGSEAKSQLWEGAALLPVS